MPSCFCSAPQLQWVRPGEACRGETVVFRGSTRRSTEDRKAVPWGLPSSGYPGWEGWSKSFPRSQCRKNMWGPHSNPNRARPPCPLARVCKESRPLSAGWTPYTVSGGLARALQPPLLEPLAVTRPWNNRATGRCKACLGGKHLGSWPRTILFIQKLLLSEFPPSFNQARKPALMGTTHLLRVGVPSWWAVGMGSNGDAYQKSSSVS